jgi:hypothetical protein
MNADIVDKLVRPKHVGPQDLPAEVGITIVRHPLSWWKSVYRNRLRWWRQDRRDLAGKHLNYYPGIDRCEAGNYRKFMRNILDAGLINAWWDDCYDHPCIKHVLRQENMTMEYIDVLKELGEEFDPAAIWDLPPVNAKQYAVNRKVRSNFMLPRGLRDQVVAALDKDLLARFGYT